MNKTVNINIGGLFFHIDEDAFQKLSRYFDAIKRSLSNASGKDEIMKDIEMRVAELFSDRQKSDKHVINLQDVDAVVAVMGQPEDYRIDNEEDTTKQTKFSSPVFDTSRKLYRDKDGGILGGVLAGLGHYFGIDKVWFRILFLLLIWAFGTGFFVYLILWIIIPEAKTTTEKLEMTGEPINISNIEKKVRQEFENVSDKIKNADYDKIGNQVKNGAERVGSSFGDFLIAVFKVFAKIIGAFIVLFSSILLIAVCVSSIMCFFSPILPSTTILNHFHTHISLDTPMWLQGILFLFAFGIPLFFLLILGLKLISSNIKSISNNIKYTLLALWIIATAALAIIAILETSKTAYEGKDVQKQSLLLQPTDTLFVKFKTNDYYSKEVSNHRSFWVTNDSNNHEITYSNNVTLHVMKTDEPQAYLQIEKFANGSSTIEANKLSKSLKYGYTIENNRLILDNYLLSNIKNESNNQKVELYLYLPKGTLLKMDENVQDYDDSDDNFFNLHFSSPNYVYKVGDAKIKCLNCPENENEYNDVENQNFESDTTDTDNDQSFISKTDSISSIEVNKDGILVKKQTKTGHSENVIKINKNGVQINTK